MNITNVIRASKFFRLNFQKVLSIREISSNKHEKFNRTHYCGKIGTKNIGETVSICGWVQSLRYKKFVLIRDVEGTVQVFFDDKFLQNGQNAALLDSIYQETVVSVSGKVRRRPAGQENAQMKTGSIEIECDRVEILNPVNENRIPFTTTEFNRPTNEATRLKYRYLDLRFRQMQQNLIVRSNFVHTARQYLNENHFLDIETPTLFRRTPGGAREFIVPTNKSGQFYCLTQSPQQFKQLLMVAGFDRYYQVARCYRDEMTKPDRQPEFTQIDLEMSFVNQNDVIGIIEGLLERCWPLEPKPTIPFRRMKYADAINYYGIDKPDVRFEMKINNLTEELKRQSTTGSNRIDSIKQDDQFCAFGIRIPSDYLETDLIGVDHVEKAYKQVLDGYENVYKNQLTFLTLKNDTGSHLAKHVNEQTKTSLKAKLNSNQDEISVILISKNSAKCLEILGKLRLHLADLIDARKLAKHGSAQHVKLLRDPKKFEFLWVEDFPLFTKNEETNKLESTHHPFTAPINEHVNLVRENKNLEHIIGLHYDLVLNGNEIAGGSIRIHDSSLQRHILKNILNEDTQQLEHLIEALEYGAPPHGGIAIGLDRLISIILGLNNIRDVIAFPKNQSGRDLMSSSPSTVSQEELDYYKIRCVQDEQK